MLSVHIQHLPCTPNILHTYLCVLYTVCSYHQMLETKVKPLKNKLDSMNQFMEDLKKKLVSWNDKMLVRTHVLCPYISNSFKKSKIFFYSKSSFCRYVCMMEPP